MSQTARRFGYHGQYLHIDVSSGATCAIELSSTELRRYLGGVGLATLILGNHHAASYDPLSEEATLVFAFSPLVGSPLTTSAKFAVCSKSPLTNRLNDSLCSSHFAIAGKQCGYDAIAITGRSPSRSVLVVDNGQVRLEPAEDLWGRSCPETESILAKRFAADHQFAVIGPAGENLVRFATISHDGRHAGRGGSGAVLGSKNIKAIAVRGDRRVDWADRKRLISLAKEISRASFGPATAKYRELGTAANLLTFNRLHALPTRNFQSGSFDGAEALAPEQLGKLRDKTQKSCAACTIGCEHLYSVAQAGAATKGTRVEYENLFALGPLCDIGDPDVVLNASRRCDALGLDTISAGGTIAFAMECRERGLVDATWLGFGDGKGLLKTLTDIALRRGHGNDLAEGSRILAHRIGGGSIDFAPQVKGLEIPGYEPRALQTMALGFAVGSRGADHNRSGAYEVDFSENVDRRNIQSEQVALAIQSEDRSALMDSLILCKFLRGVFADFTTEASNMLDLVTGWETTADELRTTAQRIVSAKKLFNIRAGWEASEDTLPKRMLTEALADDTMASLDQSTLDQLVATYNEQRGWERNGIPTTMTLRQLSLPDPRGA